ncbi:MAG: peptide deformylase [Candidatus Omnitrophota bacterium]
MRTIGIRTHNKMIDLELKIYPESCLRIKTIPVENFKTPLSETLRTMADIMYLNNGIGLAATQVGIGTRFLIIDIGEGPISFINPEIVDRSRKKTHMEEGCLSLPGVAVNVPRPEHITVRAQDENGEAFVKNFTGLMARVMQHEIDHLNGKLIIDYLGPLRRAIAIGKLAIKRKERK